MAIVYAFHTVSQILINQVLDMSFSWLNLGVSLLLQLVGTGTSVVLQRGHGMSDTTTVQNPDRKLLLICIIHLNIIVQLTHKYVYGMLFINKRA